MTIDKFTCACVCYVRMYVILQRGGQRKKCASCHIVIHTGCLARLDQVSSMTVADVAATDACDQINVFCLSWPASPSFSHPISLLRNAFLPCADHRMRRRRRLRPLCGGKKRTPDAKMRCCAWLAGPGAAAVAPVTETSHDVTTIAYLRRRLRCSILIYIA